MIARSALRSPCRSGAENISWALACQSEFISVLLFLSSLLRLVLHVQKNA